MCDQQSLNSFVYVDNSVPRSLLEGNAFALLPISSSSVHSFQHLLLWNEAAFEKLQLIKGN